MRYLICVTALSLAACADQSGGQPSGESESVAQDSKSGTDSLDTVVAPLSPRGAFMGTPIADVGLKSLSSGLDDLTDDDAPSAQETARPEGAEVKP